MSELESQLLKSLESYQKKLEEQLLKLSEQLRICQTNLSDSSDQLKAYRKNQVSLMKRVFVLEKKLKIASLPSDSQGDEESGTQEISPSLTQDEEGTRLSDRVREIICLDSEEERSREIKNLPLESNFIMTYESVVELGWVDIHGKLTEKGKEERARLLKDHRLVRLHKGKEGGGSTVSPESEANKTFDR